MSVFKLPSFRSGNPLCAVPSKSPGPRRSQSASATSKPSLVFSSTASFATVSGDFSLLAECNTTCVPAPDAPAELMQLRQTETLGILDQHDGGVGNIDAHFDHGRADQRTRFALGENGP